MFNILESKKFLLPKNCSWIFKYISIMISVFKIMWGFFHVISVVFKCSH